MFSDSFFFKCYTLILIYRIASPQKISLDRLIPREIIQLHLQSLTQISETEKILINK